MPPNKPKLYKNTGSGKANPKPQKPVQNNVPVTQPGTSTTATEMPNQEQFEVELYWCIQQLQKALGSGKLNNKQVQDNTKALNILMSNTAPLPRKRQVMRLSFGDYRQKMASEEKKLSKNAANMKLQPATTNKKTVFLKKSLFASNVENSFKFNFSINENDTTEETVTVSDNQEQNSVTSEPFHFKPSNNGFRFNFDIENAPCDKTE
ncbi:UPF0488 protein CG14286 [Diabrotica virgifera virgifera]|uniref:Uncharacterized protein n=1 Tax=Diabrotica virgifera virgifera TaxID=50390 RepID=A0ABM5L0Q5_DIAVI|nr:UPF0488 protein CG14286 [Diabrotica virgifera virgifera]